MTIASLPPNKRTSGNLILVGMMGCGKTTVGRILAKQLGKKFIDSDEEIQLRTGVKIAHIFDLEGEEGFRQRESAVLQDLLKLDNIVLATGGGVVLKAENRLLLQENGMVIYLKSSVYDLWQRTRRDQTRPLLQTSNPRATLQDLFDLRDPIYRAVADHVVHTGKQNVHAMTEKMFNIINELEYFSMINAKFQTLNLGLNERSYAIQIGQNLLEQSALLLKHIPHQRVVIITNETVAPLYLARLTAALKQHAVQVQAIILPDGERYKNNASLNIIYDALLSNRCERTTPLIALGGGVIGDMTGYAAATYLRGVPFIQIPTTLLAQVDSSVGGKTGINHPLGKNMIGAFYQPKVVVADVATLQTLPDRELRAGLAEVIKYGLIRDLPFLEWLELNMERLLQRDADALQYAIVRSCQNKAAVVGVDERESGERALLNLGHTFGHAIENAMGYGVWLHGEAVAAGTMLAVELSQRLGWLTAEDVARVRRLWVRAELPTVAPALGAERYIQLMGLDKKVAEGKIRFVLLKQLGEAVITANVALDLLTQTLESCGE